MRVVKGYKRLQKLAIITHNMSFGGVQRVVKNLIDSFCDKFQIALILFENKHIEYELPENIEILTLKEREFDYQNLIKQDKKIVTNFGEELFRFRVDCLCEILDFIKPHTVLSHEDYNNLITAEALDRVDFHGKSIFVSHVFMENYRDKLIHLLDFEFYKRWIKQHYKNRKIVAVSRGVSKDLQDLGIESTIIENGVNIKEVTKKSKTESIPNSCYILCIGRIEFAQKGQDDLLRAYARIKDEISHTLLFVGEGKDSDKLKNLVTELNLNDKVEMLGFQKNPFVFMKNATMVIFPSYYEGLPNTILEALALGIPILSYDFEPSSLELSDDGVYFELVKKGDIESLSNKIKEILNNKERLENLSKLSKARAASYSLQKMIKKWESIL